MKRPIPGRRTVASLLLVATLVTLGGTRALARSSSGDAAATAPRVKPKQFTTDIDNPYFPLRPGSSWIYRGTADGGAELDVMTVTYATRTIMGVQTVVVRDTVTVDGALLEDTFDWYAQDKRGNVWYFGEDTKLYENGGVVSTEGSWEAGVDGARPGIIMEARPRLGDTYQQEFAEGVAEDMAAVLGLNVSVSVPYGSFNAALLTKEWTPLEPGNVGNKYYAPCVGMILDKDVQGGSDRIALVEYHPAAAGNHSGNGNHRENCD